jgi:hypothetical protein
LATGLDDVMFLICSYPAKRVNLSLESEFW